MKRLVVVCLAVLFFAAPSWAQLSEKYADWEKGPVRWLLTQDEQKAYEALTSDEAAQHFIDLFWAKRDPNLETKINEFKLDYNARVAAADKQFTEEKGPRGALTDRGRVLIVLGKPAKRWHESIQAFISRIYGSSAVGGATATSARGAQSQMHGVSFNPSKGQADVWVYTREQIPQKVKLPKRVDSVIFAFLDNEGTDHYILDRQLKTAKWGLRALEMGPNVYLLHPDMTEIPSFPLLQGTTVAKPKQLAWLDMADAPWPDGAAAGAVPGVTTEHIFPAWVYVMLPKGTPPADRIVGRLTGPDGKVEGTFQKRITGIKSVHGMVYELSVPAQIGTSKLELALASLGKPLAVRTVMIELEDVPSDSTWMTPFVAGAEIYEQKQYTAGTPFVYGGYHLVLRPDGNYDFGENLDYFCLVVRPKLGEDGKPNVKVKIAIYQDGKRLTGRPFQDAALSPVEPNVYMYGSQLPLTIFNNGGSFTFKVTLKDMSSGVERTTELPLVLPVKKK